MKVSPPTPAPFLPTSPQEMRQLGWDAVDVLLVTGDAYVDHPAFGMAVIGRVLEGAGFRVGVVAQPDWTRAGDFEVMGAPRLFVGVTAGAMDSMVANYTSGRRRRRDDAYTPGGGGGRRPDYATIVYTNVVRHAFPGVPVVIGGIEASLRRFAHYDYWKNRVRRSILLDSKADLLVAGMGEKAVVKIARRLKAGRHLHRIAGTVEALSADALPEAVLRHAVRLPSYEEVRSSPRTFLEAAVQLEQALACGRQATAADRGDGPPPSGPEQPVIVQAHGERQLVEWPAEPMTAAELDAVYALPFQRRAHPSYSEKVPALEPVQFSVVSHRGCFGGCTFCALSPHQGRRIVSRSPASILGEIETLTRHPDFHGTITDVGGPTANMYAMGARDEAVCARCRRPSCLWPDVCPNLETSHGPHLALLRRALRVPGVKHLFIASGIRHDLILAAIEEERARPEAGAGAARGKRALRRGRGGRSPQAKARTAHGTRVNEAWLEFLAKRLVGGHLSVAPEHVADRVLGRMRKPPIRSFIEFEKRFEVLSAAAGKEQYITPYFIASFPGSTDADMKALMRYLKLSGRKLQQVQDFLPAPMTPAAAMYHAERDARTLRKIYVAKTLAQRRSQREMLLYHEQERAPRAARPKPKPSGAKPRARRSTRRRAGRGKR